MYRYIHVLCIAIHVLCIDIFVHVVAIYVTMCINDHILSLLTSYSTDPQTGPVDYH